MKTLNTELGVVRPRRSVALHVTLHALTLYATTCFAATLVTSLVDGGGQRTTSDSYTMDGSIGGIGGISSAGSQVTRHGYPGQLTEATGLSVTGTPAQVDEGDTSQLSGTATMDDATLLALAGSDITWGAYAWPIHGISASGVATTDVVYANTPGSVNGSYLGANGSGSLLVLDSNPDDYDSYAGDTLPDSWQVQYFGLPPNPNAATNADVTGTGQNNLFKYTAGLDPTNTASVFKLRIAAVPGQPSQMKLTFLPWASGRAYTTEYRINLVSGAYTNLTGYSGPTTNDTEVSLTDTDATEAAKFYRIKITYP